MPDTNLPSFDRQAALDRLGGDAELLKELAELFLQEYPGSLLELHAALDREDPDAVQNVAHGLKGVISNFGAKPAVAAASALENLGRRDRLEEAPPVLAELEQSLAVLREELAGL